VLNGYDFFKKVNDNYGHDVGDATIKEISNILKRSARNSDVVCRWGGEEFLILVPNTSMQELSNFANRIRKLVEQRDISTKDGLINFKVTISLGVALSNKTNVSNAENIINEADDRLYKAKNSGRNKVVYE
jgi:diguanylate cyclase (GGDEF)-like protein